MNYYFYGPNPNIMTKYSTLTLIVLLSLFCFTTYGQTPLETAHQKGEQAVKLEDAAKFDDALVLLAEAQKLDPDNIAYPYEVTYCYYSQKQYQKVIDILEKLKDRSDSFDRLYELLGNSYDSLGQSDKAIAVYENGLKRFPNSGVLYLERGVIPLFKKNYDEAIKYFEKGIEVQPDFPSNYFWAAKLYCASQNSMWGMLYGELFMNLERNSNRTQEISKLLFDTYKSQITFTAPGKISVRFSKNATISDPAKLPYSMIYEPTMGIAVATETVIDLNSLDRIRQNFLKFYMDKFNKDYPNAIFTYQNQVAQSGNMEAYDHWLLMKGDENAFNTWMAANPNKWDNFTKWYLANPIKLDDNNKFYRGKY
jgi:tetratricopeptide (TPR) repeat protein